MSITTQKQTKTPSQLASAAADVLMVFLDDLMDISNGSRRITMYRYMTFKLMEEAGYTHQQIADHFKVTRETITKGIGKIEDWLSIYRDVKGDYLRLQTMILKEV